MIVRRHFSPRRLLVWSGHHVVWLTLWVSAVAWAHDHFHETWVNVPLAPLTIMATAVAFYLGFKNNSAYERVWEARKIWGAIVNSSRTWASAVKGFVSEEHADGDVPSGLVDDARRRLVHRHIAWLYQLREQLLKPTSWEHATQPNHIGIWGRYYQEKFGIGLYREEEAAVDRRGLLSDVDHAAVAASPNGATRLVDLQAEDLRELHAAGLIDSFRHMHLQGVLGDLYTHQGKCERIKKFPLPRQYGSSSQILVALFIFMLPPTLVSQFDAAGVAGHAFFIPITVLVCWVFIIMELVGDYSENPFQSMANDIPMLGLSRTIERDLRAMLGESELPPPIPEKDGILM